MTPDEKNKLKAMIEGRVYYPPSKQEKSEDKSPVFTDEDEICEPSMTCCAPLLRGLSLFALARRMVESSPPELLSPVTRHQRY